MDIVAADILIMDNEAIIITGEILLILDIEEIFDISKTIRDHSITAEMEIPKEVFTVETETRKREYIMLLSVINLWVRLSSKMYLMRKARTQPNNNHKEFKETMINNIF